MLDNEEIFEFLKNKGAELSNWLKKNFSPYTAIIITDTEFKIVETLSSVKTKEEQNDV